MDKTGENIPAGRIFRSAGMFFPYFSRFSQHPAHGIGRLYLRRGGDVGVGVQREARAEVSQHAADGLYIHAVLQRQRCEGVPEIVDS